MHRRRPHAAATPVVTAFIENEGKILLLHRSDRVRTYPGLWAGVSGYLEHHTPEEQAWIEVREETGLTQQSLTLSRRGIPLQVVDADRHWRWRVHPFLFHCREEPRLQLDWENRDYRWIEPIEIEHYPTVPGLKQALVRCLDGH